MNKFLNPKTVIGTLLLTLALGVISSALWDFLFKPGFTEFGRVALSTLTLGSATIKNFSYASAALDPTPLPALLFVLLGNWLVFGAVGFLYGKKRGQENGERSMEEARQESTGDPQKLAQILKGRLVILDRKWKRIAITLSIFACVISFVASSVLNQSIAVWRVFHADLKICAPYLASEQEEQFIARFSSMKTREDYIAISNDLLQVATKSGVSLVNFEPW